MTTWNVYANIIGQTTDDKETVGTFQSDGEALAFAADQQLAFNPAHTDGGLNFFIGRVK